MYGLIYNPLKKNRPKLSFYSCNIIQNNIYFLNNTYASTHARTHTRCQEPLCTSARGARVSVGEDDVVGDLVTIVPGVEQAVLGVVVYLGGVGVLVLEQ